MDHEKWLEQHDQMMADHEVMWARHEIMVARHDREMAEIREGHARLVEGQARLEASHDATERTLRRAIRLAVMDARRQRERNRGFDDRHCAADERHREFDEKMTQIANAQLVNEQLLKRFLERGGNGHQPE